MVVAKNQKTFLWLKEQFAQRKVQKKYLALVLGDIKEDTGEISYPIDRAKGDPTKQTAYPVKKRTSDGASNTKFNPPASAREALTQWKVIKNFPGFTYLELSLKTGRKHQIRVHLNAIGHPVAGDTKYGPARTRPKHLGRMFLHAASLGFTAKNGEKFFFSSPLPKDLANTLKNLPFMLD